MPTRETVSQCEENLVAQRRWPRFCVDMPVRLTVKTQGPTKVLAWEGQGSDISCGGLAVTVKGDLPIGSQIQVEFTPPNSTRPMSFRCFVRNRDGHRYGVEFITENDDDYARGAELQSLLGCDVPAVSS